MDSSNPLNNFDEINLRGRFHMYKATAAAVIISLLETRLLSDSFRGMPSSHITL